MQNSNPAAYPVLLQAASLLVYQSVLASEGGQSFLALLTAIHQVEQDGSASGRLDCLRAYGRWFSVICDRGQSWQDYLITSILQSDNPFTRQAQRTEFAEIDPALVAAARHDLQVLQQLARCNSPQLSAWVMAATQLPTAPVVWKPNPGSASVAIASMLQSASDWGEMLKLLAAHYHKYGVGLIAEFRALRWQAGQLTGIAHPDPVQITDLVGYDAQQDALVKNTEFLLKGYAALHVLLYGSRGSGKSSLVKALLNQYGDRGLRLIEVAKSDLQDLPAICDRLRHLPQKFIVFVDDLSFEEDEDAYKALKVVLEGSLTARPANIVVYATSNRRHLIREFFGDRPRPKDSDEVHAWDTVQEKLSFSDRFGLTLTFEPPDQGTYLQIVHHLAKQTEISLSQEELDYQALQWATRHNGRSGRTARQFVDFLHAGLRSEFRF